MATATASRDGFVTPDDSDQLARWLRTPAVRSALAARDPLVDQHGVEPFRLAMWERHVEDPVALEVAAAYDGRTISRSDLARHADEALSQDSGAAWTAAYMACQLWGVGRSGRIHWTARTLRDPATPAAFASLARAVVGGEPERAAGRWADGWNQSFTTKFAYAVSKAVNNASRRPGLRRPRGRPARGDRVGPAGSGPGPT